MKRLIVSALFISVFFIGVSSLINGVGATMKSDAKALELVRAARIALGGNQNLATVKSMTIKGTTTHFFEKAGVQDVKQGSVEIDFEMPGRFAKRITIGTPGDGTEDVMIDKDVEVIVSKADGPTPADMKADGNVFIVRKNGDKNVDWKSDSNNDVRVEGDKVIIKKEDGTVEEIKTDGKSRVMIMKDSDGTTATVNVIGDEDNSWETNDGKKIRIEKDVEFGHGGNSNEMLRMTMALLMTAPDDGSVSYKFLGEGNVDGFASNIIGVESNGGSFKLYLDSGSNLPQMISYEGHGPHRVIFTKDKNMTKEEIIALKESSRPEPVTQMIKFSDFRSVGSLLLPHRWTEITGDKTTQNIDITSFEINPANIAEKFGGEGGKMIIKKRMN